jgi:glycerol-3-phosphate acyltransferase PlsY
VDWILVAVAYLVGSLQWGLYVVHLTHGIDIRAEGSGRTGSTNVLRTAGKAAALVVLLADFGKGTAIVVLTRVISDDSLLHAAVATAVIFGHIWPILAGFRGGRGIATGLGSAAAIDPLSAAVGLVVFGPLVGVSRYVSLGSVLGVLTVVATLSVRAAAFDLPVAYAAYGLVAGSTIVIAHRDNIKRVLRGTERRIGEPVA